MPSKKKLIPVGISNFETMIIENYLLVDKSRYIEQLESEGNKTQIFLRPRRFGKSLFLSMMSYYYDVKEKDRFDVLFGGLYIGKKPTENKSRYLVLQLEFSGLNTDSKELLYGSFFESLKARIKGFISKYDYVIDKASALNGIDGDVSIKAVMTRLLEAVSKANQKLIVLIDEYDHFANDIIAVDNGITYKEVVQANGFVRDFYEALKEGTKTVVDRIIMTGVSPVMLDDMTSGFNIGVNVSLEPQYNEMLGFTNDEVDFILNNCDFIRENRGKKGYDKDALKDEFRKNYNGYQFSKRAKEKVYNSNMLLNFLGEWQRTGNYPESVLDPNINMDRGRLAMLAKNQNNRDMLMKILEDESIASNVEPKFSFEFMFADVYFTSLLFYMGLLTLDSTRGIISMLKIPNYVSKVTYWEYLRMKLESEAGLKIRQDEFFKVLQKLVDGDIKSFVEYVHVKIIKELSNRDLMRFDEKYLKIILMIFASRENIYRVISERECNNGYIDLIFERHTYFKDKAKHDWMIELKYLKKEDRGNLPELLKVAKQQLSKYVADEEYRNNPAMKYAVVIFVGKDEVVVEELL